MHVTVKLIDALEARRRADGLTVGAFAAHLGISREMWKAMRRGSRRAGPRTLQRILTVYPSLTDLCVIELRDRRPFVGGGDVTIGHHIVSNGTQAKGG